MAGLDDLQRVEERAPGARVLVLDPEDHDGLPALARERGATLVLSGFVPPPEVACLVERWVVLACTQTEREGWSRPLVLDQPVDPEGWLELAQGDLDGCAEAESWAAGQAPVREE
jgi:hypothetical protein